MSEPYYKAVRLDRTSHYDSRTKWRKGAVVSVALPDMDKGAACGAGIHCSARLLDAVRYQQGPSLYCAVKPQEIICDSGNKVRCTGVKVLRWLGKDEQDEIAGFKLYEANHAFNPLLARRGRVVGGRDKALEEWASVGASVWDSVRDSVGASVWASVWDSVGASVWDSVGDSVGASVWASVWDSVGASVWDSVRDSVGDSVWAYTGGLFPHITSWQYAEKLGAMPWRPLLDLWYAGYVPSFDGTTWRLHAGRKAEIVHTWRPQ